MTSHLGQDRRAEQGSAQGTCGATGLFTDSVCVCVCVCVCIIDPLAYYSIFYSFFYCVINHFIRNTSLLLLVVVTVVVFHNLFLWWKSFHYLNNQS